MELEPQQPQKVDEPGQRIEGFAHELNNLLQIISADLHLIMKKCPTGSDVATSINNAQAAVKRGAKVADQLLESSRAQVSSLHIDVLLDQ